MFIIHLCIGEQQNSILLQLQNSSDKCGLFFTVTTFASLLLFAFHQLDFFQLFTPTLDFQIKIRYKRVKLSITLI